MLNSPVLPALSPPANYRRYEVIAVVLTLLLHGALLLWLGYRPDVPPPLPAAMPMVMLAVAEQAESVPASEKLPVGVRQVQSVAQAESAPPPRAAPKLVQAEKGTESQATGALKPVNAAEKPRPRPERQPRPHPQSTASQASAAPDTTAPAPMAGSRVAAPRQQVAAAPSQNASAWSGELLAHLSRFKRYPGIAQRQQREGVVQISVTLDRDGRVLAVKLLNSSGVRSLDNEACDLPLRASPLPAPPPETIAGQASFSVSIPVRFDLRELRK